MKIYIFLNRERNFSFYFRLKKCFLVFKKPCFFAFYRKNSDCSTHVTIVGCICESNRWKIPEIKFARGVLLIFSKHRKTIFPQRKNVCPAFLIRKCFHTSSVPFVQDKTLLQMTCVKLSSCNGQGERNLNI